jgi:hypothetical protein
MRDALEAKVTTQRFILRFLIALAVSLTLGFAVSAHGPLTTVTGAYVIVASNETAQNTSDGTPLQITFDLIESGGTVAVSNVLSNSNCVNADTLSDQLVNPAVKLGRESTIESFTFGSAVDGSIFTFSITQNLNGVYTGTLSATSGCASSDSGKFTAQIVTAPAALDFYSGMLVDASGTGNEPNGYTGALTSVNFRVTGTFTMDGTTLQIRAALCHGGPAIERLTVSQLADSIGGFQSIQSGNVLLFNASDGAGTNTITFIGTPTGVDGNTDTPGNWDLTYYVDTGVCAGSQGSGSPFSIERNVPSKTVEAIHPRFFGNPGLAH